MCIANFLMSSSSTQFDFIEEEEEEVKEVLNKQ
jgi:hypothetical protein